MKLAKKILPLAGLLVFAVGHPPEASESDRLTFNGVELERVGTGVRSRFFMDVYRASLFVPPATGAGPVEVTEDRSLPKAFRIEILARNLPDDPPDVWRRITAGTLNERERSKVAALYGHLAQGDVIEFAYASDTTDVRLNGSTVLSVRDHALMSEVLEQWIGDDPVSTTLKSALLGEPANPKRSATAHGGNDFGR